MIDEVARKAREEERERLLKIVRQTLVLEPEQVNDGFILGFSNCRQRIEEALTTPLKDPN